MVFLKHNGQSVGWWHHLVALAVALVVALVVALLVAQVVALLVALVVAQEVAQVVEQKNFQHGLVVTESVSSVSYMVTFTILRP